MINTTAGKVALVTGASSGIGEATALELAKAGYTVYGAARRVERMNHLTESGIHPIPMDVTDDSSMQAAVERIIADTGRIDVLVNNAGYGSYGAHPAHPGRAAVRLSAVARQVLTSDQIELPPASVADVRSGQVHHDVLNALVNLARYYSIGVSVIRSGHPKYVFGTNRLSDHPRGRAFDTWRINGHAVVDPATPKKLITATWKRPPGPGSYNVGGPYQLAGSGHQFFSDAAHHDHVHTGFVR